MMGLSIIIPVVNEEQALSELLPYLKGLKTKPTEIIVVDGGSTDQSRMISEKYGAIFLQAKEEGRAIQQHLGALHAREDLLCFLHADTFPNEKFVDQIKATLQNEAIALGAFTSIMKGDQVRYWISYLNYIKTYLIPALFKPKLFFQKRFLLLFGDQVLFCRKLDYLACGGFNMEDKIFEDANFCLNMSSQGKQKMLKHRVYSSDRRVKKWGFFKANLIYIGFTIMWARGKSSNEMAKRYEHIR